MPRTAPRTDRAALTVITLVAALALALSACSSDSDPTSTTAAKGTTTTAADGSTKTTRAPIDPSTLKDGAKGYQVALAPAIDAYTGLDGAAAKKASDCLAPKWVKTIGVAGFAKAGLSPADVASSGFTLTGLGLSKAKANALLADVDACDIDLRASVTSQVTDQVSAQGDVSDKTKACLADAITKQFVEAGFIASVTGSEVDDATFAAVQACLAGK
ncbi:hypothetical protein [Aquihabitans sp. McL0605]|uniref:hypothetical protein n=1 Tax=Aquihabitans sp. McL0605 TaxID=3415671 RepID=UPI003CE6B3F1